MMGVPVRGTGSRMKPETPIRGFRACTGNRKKVCLWRKKFRNSVNVTQGGRFPMDQQALAQKELLTDKK